MDLPLSGLAVLAAAAALSAATVPPAGVTRYRIEQTSEQEADLVALGGPKQLNKSAITGFVTVTLGDSAGARTMRVVVDSLISGDGTDIPRVVLDSARGALFTGRLDDRGAVSGLRLVSPPSAAAILEGVLGEFYPRLRSGAKPGDAWSDTTTRSNENAEGPATVRTISRFRVSPGEGGRGLKVDAAFSAAISGAQQVNGRPATLEGTATGLTTYLLAADGRYLGGTSQQTAAISYAGVAPSPVPVTVKQTLKVTALP